MDKKKHWMLRLFFVLFTISVSVTVLPCGIINVYGMFGQITTYAPIEDKEQEIENVKSVCRKKEQIEKGKNIFNIFFEILIIAICISFYANLSKLPRGDTIVTLKVRMDN